MENKKSIKLACANIERSKHLDLVRSFLDKEQPDVFCVQELLERDIPLLTEMAGATTVSFAPMLHHMKEPDGSIVGTAILSRLPVISSKKLYYFGEESRLPELYETPDRGNTMNCALVVFDVDKDGVVFRIGTTHFTWSPEGKVDDLQRENAGLLLKTLEPLGDIVFCGDFNTPRGGEIFSRLSDEYKDNIPADCTTSIDKNMHRAGDLQLVVDGLFSTEEYDVSAVKLSSDVSDHMVITATVSKK